MARENRSYVFKSFRVIINFMPTDSFALLGQTTRIIHIIAGVSTLIAGPIAIFYNFKNVQKHRLAGRTFFWSMMVVCLFAEIGFLKRFDLPFFQFLGALAWLVFLNMLGGLRAIRLFKGVPVSVNDHWLPRAQWAVGAVMVVCGVWYFTKGSNLLPIAILFNVFGVLLVRQGFQWQKMLTQTVVPITWYRMHIGQMITGFIASTTAFTVQTCHFLPWFVQWFGPTILLAPVAKYFSEKISKKPV